MEEYMKVRLRSQSTEVWLGGPGVKNQFSVLPHTGQEAHAYTLLLQALALSCIK